MYKCTECGLEFENKPEYCDCGNDEFVLTVSEIQNEKESVHSLAEMSELGTKNIDTKISEDKIPQKQEENDYYESPVSKHESYRLPVSPYAIAIFVLCIIFSLIILFVWQPVEKTTEKVIEIIEKVENKPIPSIDKLWKTPEPVKQEEPTPITALVQKQEKKTAVVNIPKTVNTVKSTPKTTTQTVKQQPKITQNKTQKVINKTVPTKNTAANQAAKQAQDVAIKAADEAKKAQEAKQKAEVEALAAAEKARKAAMAKEELSKYKINLRNTIGQKIDFTRVIGDGDCVISFQLNSSGKLINRAFAKQSTNITLNNAVYSAVMSIPSYYAPPSAYNNEVMRLNIRFINGNFAITLE